MPISLPPSPIPSVKIPWLRAGQKQVIQLSLGFTRFPPCHIVNHTRIIHAAALYGNAGSRPLAG